uniref:Uncharacterized protein n=1 Tax=Strigamia maritima TaxID=126957 RepID=T1IP11_STRMM
MVDNELSNVLDRCLRHRFEEFNDFDNTNDAVDIFNDALERIHAMLRRQNKDVELRWLMTTYPNLSLCLTNLRSHPVVITNGHLFSLVMKCILWFYRSGECDIIQKKANVWARKQIQCAISPLDDDCQVKEFLVEKLENNASSNEQMLREFWLRNYRLMDLIEDKNMKNRIIGNLLRLLIKSPHEDSSIKITEIIWENIEKNELFLNAETKATLWLLHAPGLESDVISLLETPPVNFGNKLFTSCGLNPHLFERVVCILFAIFRATNHHPKTIQLASRLVEQIKRIKSNDAQFCSQLDPLTWLLLTHPKNFPSSEFVWKNLNRIKSNEQLAFLLCIHPDWLRFLLENIHKQPETELLSTCSRLIHSTNCRQCLLSKEFLVSECPRCIALSLNSVDDQHVKLVESHFRRIFPSINLDVLLDWWQQE